MIDKRARPSEPRVYRDAAFLSRCSVQEAREWLSTRRTTYSTTSGTPETPPDAPVLEYLLLRRNDPQIDLLLAEFGRSQSVLERVFERSCMSTRAVACSNASLFVGGKLNRYRLDHSDEPLFWRVIQNGSLAELRALCENPHLSSRMYDGLLNSWVGNEGSRIDENLRTSDERFMQIVRFLAENPRLKIDREDSHERHYLDGFADYEYGLLFSGCWRLAEIVPVNETWARILSQLYLKMKPAYKPYDDVSALLERWHPDQEGKYANTRILRQTLAAHYIAPTVETLNHEDEAYRRAFYRTFDPEQKDFRDLDWMEWRNRDKFCEYDLEANEKIWRSPRGRRKLEQLLWDASSENSDISGVGWFRQRQEEYREQHPEWFRDEDEGEDFEDDYDEAEAQRAYDRDVAGSTALYRGGTFAAEASTNDLLGKRMLQEELGYHGTKGLVVYKLDDIKRDRLIAHSRQDVAAAFGHAKSAFRSAKNAEKAAKRSQVLLWVVIGLLAYVVLFG